MNNITVKAYGKINIALDILGRRPDGYHEVSMIMQSVSLADELVFEAAGEPGITLMYTNSEDPGEATPGRLSSDDHYSQGRPCFPRGTATLYARRTMPLTRTSLPGAARQITKCPYTHRRVQL